MVMKSDNLYPLGSEASVPVGTRPGNREQARGRNKSLLHTTKDFSCFYHWGFKFYNGYEQYILCEMKCLEIFQSLIFVL